MRRRIVQDDDVPHARSRRSAIRKVALNDRNAQARSREFTRAGAPYNPGSDNDDVIDHCFEEKFQTPRDRYSETDAASKRVGGVEVQRRLPGNPRPPGDAGSDTGAVAAMNGALKDSAEYPFLPPDFIQPQLSCSVKAGKLRACAGSARGTVERCSRTKHEVAAGIASDRRAARKAQCDR